MNSRDDLSLDPESPWPGLPSFTRLTWQYFFGREEEIQELCDRIKHLPLTVLFGKSGLGKTSLLQAGLMLELESRGYVPVYLRFDFSDSNQPLEEQILRELFDAVAGTPHRELVKALRLQRINQPGRVNLWNLFHSPELGFIDRDGNMLVRPVLILDQFEEVLRRAGGQMAEDFRVALSDLIENRVPIELQRRLEEDKSLVTRLLLPGRPCKVLLSLREDRLHELERWRAEMPSLLENRYELRSLTGPKALRAVYEPGRKREEKSPIVGEDLAAKIVRFVAGVKTAVNLNDIAEVSPPLLSLMCREMNERRKREGRDELDEEYLSKKKSQDILRQFYEQSLAGKPPVLRKLIEDELLSEDGGSRIPVALITIFEKLKINQVPENVAKEAIEGVVNSRLLVYRELNNQPFVELTHDVLMGVAKISRDRRRERETNEKAARDIQQAKQNEIEEANRRRAAEQQERRERANRITAEKATEQAIKAKNLAFRLMYLVGFACLLCVILLVIIGVFAWRMHRQEAAIAEDNTRVANEYLLQAEWEPAQWRKGIQYLARALSKNPQDQAGAERLFHELMIHRVNAERLPFQTFPKGTLDQAVFSPDSQVLVTFTNRSNTAQLRRTASPEEVWCSLTHDGPIVQVAFSPKNDRILTASDDGTAKLWKIGNPRAVGVYRHHSRVLQALFNQDGSKILSMDADKNVFVWDIANDSKNSFPPGADLQQVLFTPDGKQILTVQYDLVQFWDAVSFKPGVSFKYPQQVLQASFTPRGDQLVTACSDHIVYCWNFREREKPLKLKLPNVLQISDPIPTNDGCQILITTDDHKVALWEIPSDGDVPAKAVRSFQSHQGREPPILLGDKGRLVVTASADGEAKVWDSLSGELQASLQFGGTISQMACSPDGTYLVTAGEDLAMLWKATLRNLEVSVQKVNGVSDSTFSPDNQRFVAASVDGTATVWDAASGAWCGTMQSAGAQSLPPIVKIIWCQGCIVTVHRDNTINLWNDGSLAPIGPTIQAGGQIYEVVTDQKGKRIVVAGAFGGVMLIEAKSGKLQDRLPHGSAVWHAMFSPDGQEVLTVCGDGKARLWDIGDNRSPKVKRTWSGPESGKPGDPPVIQAVFLQNLEGNPVLTVCEDGTACLRHPDGRDSKPFKMARGISQMAFDPKQGRLLTIDAANKAELWDASSAESLGRQVGMLQDEHIQKAFFSGDGEFVLIVDDDRRVKLFDARSGNLAGVFAEPATVAAAGFNSDGTRILIAAKDRVELRDIKTPKELFSKLTAGGGLLSHSNLLQDEVKLLAQVTTGGTLSDSGARQAVVDRSQLVQNVLKLEAEKKVVRDDFFHWLCCDDDKITIFPGSPVTPSQWVKNSAGPSPTVRPRPDHAIRTDRPVTVDR